MNRREVLKAAAVATGVMISGKAFADREMHKGGQKVNRLSNRDKPSMMEKKHVPAIEAPHAVGVDKWFDVKVRVGYLAEHPSTQGHWITEIKLMVDGKKIVETDYDAGGILASEASFRIRLNKTSRLEAVEHCNLHGVWISDPVEVKVA
jgi:superoxide reductase